MGKPTGFMEIGRKESGYRPVQERTGDFGEVEQTLNDDDRRAQASRCMDCGIPFCHWACTVCSKIPEWQDALYRGDYGEAYEILSSTNAFPEFTGRICPALCEKSCVLNIHNEPVTIRENELAVVEKAFELGLVQPRVPYIRTGKKIAVIGSGPAGLSAADLLNQQGHNVTVYEADNAIGGLLRYGIPDFKLNKGLIDRRQKILEAEEIEFIVNTKVGVDVSKTELLKKYDAVCIAVGAMKPRDLEVEGRDAKGIYFAMEFLKQQNKVVRGEKVKDAERISAENKNVLVIGGGDTGSDCVGTSIRQKAKSVTQIEIMPKPPRERTENNPWPYWPNTLRTSSSHLEGCERRWSLATKKILTENGKVCGAEVVQVKWDKDSSGCFVMSEVPGTEQVIKAELILLSMGFVSPEHQGLLDALKVEYDARGNVKTATDNGLTNVSKVFACGDANSGASLVVRAIDSGRRTAMQINKFLTSK
ncbi:MAG: glutamate synthase subunit beta [Prolixibacteraceae bacterium]|nr:glutamate synthase subunit beta [Prolixibacteraceae bacterium]MBN2649967.1 glutamate synthase subunit beta [Prolixibacteraceae bacterium]